MPCALSRLSGLPCFLDAEVREARVLPAREKVLHVPVALAVADEDEKAVHVVLISGEGRGWVRGRDNPRTSAMV